MALITLHNELMKGSMNKDALPLNKIVMLYQICMDI